MFWSVVEREIRDVVKSPKFVISFGVSAFAILLAFYVGVLNYRLNQCEYEAAINENRRQLEGLTDWSSLQDYRVFLPPSPVAALASGVSDDVGRTIKVSWMGVSGPYGSRFGDSSLLALFRHLDLQFLFGVLLSLFAILMCYDAVSGEKERGTLRLVFSNDISRPTYLLGKMAGCFLAIGVPLLAAMAIGSLLLPLMGLSMSTESWLRLAAMIATGLTFVLCFMALSIMVSSLTIRSTNSLLILLVIWTISVQMLPRAAVFAGGMLVDVPSVDGQMAQEEQLGAQLQKEYKEKLTNFHPSANADGAQAAKEARDLMEKLTTDNGTRVQEFANRLEEARRNQEGLRADVGLVLSRISPYSSLNLSLATLAGTDLELGNRFRDQAGSFRGALTSFLKEKTGSYGGFGGQKLAGKDARPVDASEFPIFIYSPAAFGETMVGIIPDIAVLLLYSLTAAGVAFWAFNRYDLR